jgi:DNA-binding MurR/RpiR family transcriptional regulator
VTADDPRPVLVRIQGLLPELSGAVAQVAREVLDDPGVVTRSTIVELAESTGTSPGTVTRFCRALGLQGYPDLRMAVAAEMGRVAARGWEFDLGTEIAIGDGLDTVLRVISAADLWALQATIDQIDVAAIERVVETMATADRIDLYGIASSAVMAMELQLRLHRIGRPSWAWSEVHAGLTSAALLGPGDFALAVSFSGRTRETVELLAEAAGHGALTVAVTSFPRSPLADIADVVLTTAVRETTFRAGTLASRHSQLLVLDLIYIGVAQRTHERSVPAFEVTARAVAAHRTDGGPRRPARRRRPNGRREEPT